MFVCRGRLLMDTSLVICEAHLVLAQGGADGFPKVLQRSQVLYQPFLQNDLAAINTFAPLGDIHMPYQHHSSSIVDYVLAGGGAELSLERVILHDGLRHFCKADDIATNHFPIHAQVVLPNVHVHEELALPGAFRMVPRARWRFKKGFGSNAIDNGWISFTPWMRNVLWPMLNQRPSGGFWCELGGISRTFSKRGKPQRCLARSRFWAHVGRPMQKWSVRAHGAKSLPRARQSIRCWQRCCFRSRGATRCKFGGNSLNVGPRRQHLVGGGNCLMEAWYPD